MSASCDSVCLAFILPTKKQKMFNVKINLKGTIENKFKKMHKPRHKM